MAFDPAFGKPIFEAGDLLGDIIAAFLPRGWLPMVTPGTKFVTLGGAIAADVRGKNHHRDGSFRGCVDWIDIMGELSRDCPHVLNGDLGPFAPFKAIQANIAASRTADFPAPKRPVGLFLGHSVSPSQPPTPLEQQLVPIPVAVSRCPGALACHLLHRSCVLRLSSGRSRRCPPTTGRLGPDTTL
jgi:hypothetical protein